MPRRKTVRPKAPKGTAPQQRIEFSYHPHLNTPEGQTYRYLLRNPLWTADQGKSMVNETILTRFLPYARQQTQPELARAIAQQCLRQLQRYIDELCRDFGLDTPSGLPSAPYRSPEVQILPATATHQTSPQAVDIEAAYARFDVFE